MARTVGIGIQDFAKMIINNCFYVDKTDFIREWWERKDDVTLITRPRRFGKTLNMSMLEQFFSVDYGGRGDLFQGLSVWKDEKYRQLQGTYPVISLSFARVKEMNYPDTREKICEILRNLYIKHTFLKESQALTDADRAYYDRILEPEISNTDATSALYQLSDYLYRYYGKKVIILLDEYDTPMQEAFVGGYREEAVAFMRSLFNSTFKTNPWLERAVMTGITRISKESIFSDLNNLKVVTTTSDEYATSFGFTEEEVFAALEECGLSEKKADVKCWYDGFIFGEHRDIYNPWSIINFLDTGKLGTHWANTSSNGLAGKLIREGSRAVKEKFEILIQGGTIQSPIDEQIVYNQLKGNEEAVWSLLLASGYLKVLSYEDYSEIPEDAQPVYELTLTNLEVRRMFQSMIREWFREAEPDYNDFIKALLQDDLDAMNEYMNRVALRTFSYFDTGNSPSGAEPERFYHGFVLGLLVDLQGKYLITSNRESGFGRYDVILEPRDSERDASINNCSRDAIIIEFKVRNQRREGSLEDTVQAALQQIREKQYAARLLERGIPAEHIRCYGFAFEGKKVLIG
ncbi:ATP-binding protein [Acetatifactor muris]|uniref:Putative AAA-ATPase n=1 Tax=Acetatifactor muris TaxID=879566 RepID=A0A2K4ZCX5_9FIRM|nr:AAA family ATPase [Acetatifactor muris]MCR2046725.1 ATP-binding protein [Acetatifactor muris]SOY28317.1 putative AAA-ATPase [Acetatifactor muris]